MSSPRLPGWPARGYRARISVLAIAVRQVAPALHFRKRIAPTHVRGVLAHGPWREVPDFLTSHRQRAVDELAGDLAGDHIIEKRVELPVILDQPEKPVLVRIARAGKVPELERIGGEIVELRRIGAGYDQLLRPVAHAYPRGRRAAVNMLHEDRTGQAFAAQRRHQPAPVERSADRFRRNAA